MLSSEDLISCIVPVYNASKYLDKCVNSIINQTYNNIELILINDGSEDNSGSICDSFIRKDNRVRVFHIENHGVSYARNFGLKKAKGKWIYLADADDWLELNMLETLHSVAEKEGASIVFCNYINEFNSKSIIPQIKYPNTRNELFYQFMKFPTVFMNAPWNKLFLKEIIDENNLHFEDCIKICEDLLFSFEFCWLVQKYAFCNEPLYHYNRTNEFAATKNIKESYVEDKIFVTDKIVKILSEENASLYENLINTFKLYAKLLYIINPTIRNGKKWRLIYPESSNYIFKSNLRKDFKVLSWLVSKHLSWLAFLIQDTKQIFKRRK